jgi:methionyl-tRNA formyltransferase
VEDPPDALATPRHGIVNGHPRCFRATAARAMSWAIRNGERISFTFHYMDAELDTGNILGQVAIPLGDEHGWEELTPKLATAVETMLPGVLARVARGDPGDPQDESAASYFHIFEPEYAWIDWSRSTDEIERQVRAWRFHSRVPGDRGALAEVDGETVRVLE